MKSLLSKKPVLPLLLALFISLPFLTAGCLEPTSTGSEEILTYYLDADGDGYGDHDIFYEGSAQPDGYVLDDTDCDDADAVVYPTATEIPGDGNDQYCDGNDSTYYYLDADGDGYGDPNVAVIDSQKPDGYVTDSADCDDTNAFISPNAAEICGDGIDQDCDGNDLECVNFTYYADLDGDGYGDPFNSIIDSTQPAGYVTDSTDCDDQNASAYPGAA